MTELKPLVIIITGGNNLYNFKKSKENLIRDKFEIKMIKFAIKNKVPLLGICKGFQLIAKIFKSKIININNHVRVILKLKISYKIFGE